MSEAPVMLPSCRARRRRRGKWGVDTNARYLNDCKLEHFPEKWMPVFPLENATTEEIYRAIYSFGNTCSPNSSTARTGSEARLTVSISRLAPAALAASAWARQSSGLPQIERRRDR